jgi:5'-deoxynucleotidase
MTDGGGETVSSPFLAYMYRLQYIDRWSLMRNNYRENVAEHTFHVALLAHALCTIARDVYKKAVPVEQVVAAAMFHDAAEVMTGDIPTPVKHQNPEILRNFRDIERMAAERLLNMIPDPLRASYTEVLQADEEIYRWVKAADRLDAYLKCTFEVLTGNREFLAARDEYASVLRHMQMPELDYFLETFAPAFEKSLDEMQ